MARQKVEIIRYPMWTIKLTYTGWAAALAEGDRSFKRLFHRVLKSGLMMVIERWYFYILKRHFDHDAARRYGYKARRPKYDKFKKAVEGRVLRNWGGMSIRPFWVARNQPRAIVLSGATQKMATRSGIRLTGTSKRGRGTFTVPAYITVGKNLQHIPAELTKVTKDEGMRMAHWLDKHIQEKMDAA